MDIIDDSVVNATVDTSDTHAEAHDVFLHEGLSSNGEEMRELGNAGEVLTRVELHLAYSTEKLLNLDILSMNVAARESDYECLIMDNDSVSDNSVEKWLEFYLLSAIIDSEAMELEKLMASLQREIVDTREKISSSEYMREFLTEMEEKLHDSEESLKRSQDQVAEMRMQSAKLQRMISVSTGQEDCNDSKDAHASEDGFSCMNTRLMMQTTEQKRHILRMLEKSLARELDLEERLLDSRLSEEEVKQKLHSTEHEVFCMAEATEDFFGRLFEAEYAAEVLAGISKEILGRLQMAQFSLIASTRREGEMRSKLQQITEQMEAKESVRQRLETSSSEFNELLATQIKNLEANLKETEDKYTSATSEAFSLRQKITSLEEKVREYEIQVQNSKSSMEESQKQHDILCSEIGEMKNVIENLKTDILEAENRAESAEAKNSSLTETNSELNEELAFFKNSENNFEKVSLLEKQLRESDTQLQHAKASAEASQEQQNMLYSAIEDMENLINDLKSKVLKAENRAEIAEEKSECLAATNSKLDKELSFLRNRVECIEASLHQAEDAKIATAKEINLRTKIITEMVLQLAVERERLQKQISMLMNENKILFKFWRTQGGASVVTDCKSREKNVPFPCGDLGKGSNSISEEVEIEVSPTSFQMNEAAKDTSNKEAGVREAETKSTIWAEKEAGVAESNSKVVWATEAWQVRWKYILAAIMVLIISMLLVHIVQRDKLIF